MFTRGYTEPELADRQFRKTIPPKWGGGVYNSSSPQADVSVTGGPQSASAAGLPGCRADSTTCLFISA